MQIKSKGFLRRNKVTIALLAVAVIGASIFIVWGYVSRDRTADDDQMIDYSPATKEDREFNDAHKAGLGADATEQAPSDTSTTDNAMREVTPTITAYGQPDGSGGDFKLNGFVSGIIETDGTCTLTLTKDSTIAIVSKSAVQNVQDTSCGQLVLPFSKLAPGKWQAVLSYESPTSQGSSVAVTVDVK